MTIGLNYPDLETLAALISRSQIIVAAVPSAGRPLPAGFDEIDIVILEWIAAEGRRCRRQLAPL